MDCYHKTIDYAASFLKRPSESFFERDEVTKSALQEAYPQASVFSWKVVPKEGKKDVVGAKLMKAIEYVASCMNRKGFKVIDFRWEWNEQAEFFFVIEQETIDETYLQRGPKLTMNEACEQFRKTHKGKTIIEQDGYLFVEQKREHTSAKEALSACFSESYVKERIVSASQTE